ncbi:hypothetical protein T4D_7077 [Trichinella pseudospiralis]|uniref:Uncharacterized protein n=1 Tax=Trichinella pseudospiralis TaxID=6337 RepID=A0A0V1FRA3_TRIPS|nr:hypothetical protein T4D_7077 [Trichinella pseudospiralis]
MINEPVNAGTAGVTHTEANNKNIFTCTALWLPVDRCSLYVRPWASEWKWKKVSTLASVSQYACYVNQSAAWNGQSVLCFVLAFTLGGTFPSPSQPI